MPSPTQRTSRHPHPSRRDFLLAAGTGTAAWMLGGASRAAEAPEGPRVLILGDSMIAGGFGIFVARALAKEHGFSVRRRGKSSTGLARPDFFDWKEEAAKLVQEHEPDVTMVMFGGNDVQGLYMGNGEWIRWPDDGWAQEYAKRVQALCDLLAPQDHQRIFWIGLPIMRPEKFRRRCQKVNTIYRAEMAIRRDAKFIDTWDVLTDDDREYADKLVLEPPTGGGRGKRVRVRAGDGIHLSPAGAQHLKDYVLERVLPELEELRV